MRGTYTLTFSSPLRAPAASVWEAIATVDGMNAELAPWLRMTAPAEARKMRIEEAPLGTTLFGSWVLLGGIFPIDRHFFRLESVQPGLGFLEDSTSWSQRRWEHRRTVEPDGDGCVVTDRLAFTPRLGVAGPILAIIIGAIFVHRHRRLRRRFGTDQSS